MSNQWSENVVPNPYETFPEPRDNPEPEPNRKSHKVFKPETDKPDRVEPIAIVPKEM